ncbi:hypothetical protein SAMN05428989_3411 [Pseudoxanthomonas sp. GM95]|nr:hypothetical protein SAMN05428989_3411 [Pseudoxanthomonas sp. GM95]
MHADTAMKTKTVAFVLLSLLCSCEVRAGTPSSGYRRIAAIDPLQNEIGAYQKGGDFFFLKTPEIDCPGIVVVDGVLYVDPHAAVGVVWDLEGHPVSVPLFTRHGTYRLMISDNLGTEQEEALSFEKKVEVGSKDLYRTPTPQAGCTLDSKPVAF